MSLPVDVIRTLSLTLVITSVLAVETRRLRLSAAAYSVQALVIVALLAAFASINPALNWWAATALVTKAILIPWFLFRTIRKTGRNEVTPFVGLGPSVVVAALLMIGFFRLTHGQMALLAPTALAQEEVFRTNLAVASTVFVLGLYALLTRRDAVKTVIGLCLLENGVHLSLVSLAPDLPVNLDTALQMFDAANSTSISPLLTIYISSAYPCLIGMENPPHTTSPSTS
jgi:hydrogenase-4 component E